MNKYPIWKYILIIIIMLFGILYTIPNFFGESVAIQISTNRKSIHINKDTEEKIKFALQKNKIQPKNIFIQNNSIKIKFEDADVQLKALDIIKNTLEDGYIIALSLIPDSPYWLYKIHANPMFLGLDLRGGIHFIMEVDMETALQKRIDKNTIDSKLILRKEKIRNSGIRKNSDNSLYISFRNKEDQQKALKLLKKNILGVDFIDKGNNIVLNISPLSIMAIQKSSIEQNINTLYNRINALGVTDPIIQQTGNNRINVQLPGIQDVAKAKDIIGRTATLEIRLVANDDVVKTYINTQYIPNEYEILFENDFKEEKKPILVSKQVELTGDDIDSAQPGWDENQLPAVDISFNSRGANIFANLTKENRGRRIAMILIDDGKKEVITAPIVQQIITGGNVQIHGSMNAAQANDIALLLKSGSLSAPMKIIEEKTIGPSLGKDNIIKGFKSTLWGYIAIVIFIILYYRVMGVISVISLTCNLILLIAILSIMQATLTLPGIAAIALTLGMAIDANVLINERIREELTDYNNPPQTAIFNGYNHAISTIIDSNITSLIAGIALLLFGYGPIQGFAVVHCIGILTSIFSSVMISRALVNIWYGNRKNLKFISIGIKNF